MQYIIKLLIPTMDDAFQVVGVYTTSKATDLYQVQ